MRSHLKFAILVCTFFINHVVSQDDLCYEKVDILFIMDASGSVGANDFKKQLEFAATFVDMFSAGTAQFSVLRFDNTPVIVFDFDDYSDKTRLRNAILNITYTGGGTDTAAALRLARVLGFAATQGARQGVPKIAIVSTDGMSNNPTQTKLEAQQLKDSNVLVLTIGVGSSYNKQELYAIASFPEDVIEVIDYDQLVSIVLDYSELVCNEVKLFDCNNDADVFFLLDSSSRIAPNVFQNQQAFVANVTSRFKLTEYSFGAATFGGTVQKIFGLGELTDAAAIARVLSNAKAVQGASNIDGALKYILEQGVFEPESGGRFNTTKILVVLTDGGWSSGSLARITAAELRATGINIVAVGVSNANISELQELVNHATLDVVTNLAHPDVASGRIHTLTTYQDCKAPTEGVRDVKDACKKYNWENGIHPHPYDCTKFILCTFLKTDIMTCPPYEAYDPKIKTCNLIGLVESCGYNGTGPVTPFPSRPPASSTSRPPIIWTTTKTTSRPCIKGHLDILFVFDSSDSVGRPGFNESLRIATNLAEYFHLGPAEVQFAGISFGTSPQNLFNFNAYNDYNSLKTAILKAGYQGGLANTHLALRDALNEFDAAHGSRPESPKVVIIFTSGRSADSAQTRERAAILRQAGIYVIVVGVGASNTQELQAIASGPSAVVYDVRGLLNAVQNYSDNTCNEDFVCRTVQHADVIFVIDSSASISDPDYVSQLQFIANVTERFPLGAEDVQFGAVVFSHETVKLFDLKDYSSHASLRAAILSAKHLKSGTDTAGALNFVYDQDMFGARAGGRQNASKILIILTDGRSNSVEETERAARRLKNTEVHFIAIGIGNEIYIEELTLLASSNQSLFTVPGFQALSEIQDRLTKTTCDIPGYSNLCSSYRWSDGKHPNPYDCSTYVICESFNTQLFSCRTGEAYDPIRQTCTDKSSAHPCNDPAYYDPWRPSVTNRLSTILVTDQQRTSSRPVNFTTKRPPVVDINDVCRQYNLADGIYPDPGSCKHFVECTALRTDHLQCPEGLHFNTLNQVCDDVHAIDCNLNYNYFTNN